MKRCCSLCQAKKKRRRGATWEEEVLDGKEWEKKDGQEKEWEEKERGEKGRGSRRGRRRTGRKGAGREGARGAGAEGEGGQDEQSGHCTLALWMQTFSCGRSEGLQFDFCPWHWGILQHCCTNGFASFISLWNTCMPSMLGHFGPKPIPMLGGGTGELVHLELRPRDMSIWCETSHSWQEVPSCCVIDSSAHIESTWLEICSFIWRDDVLPSGALGSRAIGMRLSNSLGSAREDLQSQDSQQALAHLWMYMLWQESIMLGSCREKSLCQVVWSSNQSGLAAAVLLSGLSITLLPQVSGQFSVNIGASSRDIRPPVASAVGRWSQKGRGWHVGWVLRMCLWHTRTNTDKSIVLQEPRCSEWIFWSITIQLQHWNPNHMYFSSWQDSALKIPEAYLGHSGTAWKLVTKPGRRPEFQRSEACCSCTTFHYSCSYSYSTETLKEWATGGHQKMRSTSFE